MFSALNHVLDRSGGEYSVEETEACRVLLGFGPKLMILISVPNKQ